MSRSLSQCPRRHIRQMYGAGPPLGRALPIDSGPCLPGLGPSPGPGPGPPCPVNYIRGILKNYDFSDFPGNPFWPFWALFWPLRAPGTPESDAPWPEDSIRTIFVPIRWDLTSFRALFRFQPIPDKSRNSPRKALNRPQGGREKVAKGRAEVLERSRGSSGIEAPP